MGLFLHCATARARGNAKRFRVCSLLSRRIARREAVSVFTTNEFEVDSKALSEGDCNAHEEFAKQISNSLSCALLYVQLQIRTQKKM